MDLQSEGLPLCDGGPAADERVDRLRRAVAGCDGILITFGIYNYLAPAATKNAVEWAGRAAFEGKVVAFAAVGGGPIPALRCELDHADASGLRGGGLPEFCLYDWGQLRR